MAASAAVSASVQPPPSASTPAPTHHRQPSAALKRRPLLSRRSTAESKAQVHSHKSKRRSGDFGKSLTAGSSTVVDDADMSGGFAQFCATCETQIIVPSTSILYCSESCRRKDCGMSPPHSPFSGPYAPSAQPATADVDVDIIPPLSPTVRTNPSYYGGTTPSTPTAHDQPPRPSYDRKDSEASRYLSQFHSVERPRSLRPRSSRQSAVPSLSHSPSSSTSSSVPYTMVKDIARPLPGSSRGLVSKSVDLVTPAAAGPMPDSLETLSARAASLSLSSSVAGRAYPEEEDVYDDIGDDDAPARSFYQKRAYGDAGSATAQSSLKQLLSMSRHKS